MYTPNTQISLDETVNFYFSIFRKKKLFNLFKGLKEDLLQQYAELTIHNLDSTINGFEEFFLNVNTGITQENYDISWSIPKALKWINDKKIKPQIIKIENLYTDTNSLEYAKIKYYNHSEIETLEPIIVSYFFPISRFIVIDGNHRLYNAFLNGYKEINAFVLFPNANPSIMNERSRKLYTFHHNLVNLVQLCCSSESFKFEVNETLNMNTYFGNYKFRNLLLKKIILLVKKPYLHEIQAGLQLNSKTNDNLNYH